MIQIKMLNFHFLFLITDSIIKHSMVTNCANILSSVSLLWVVVMTKFCVNQGCLV